MRRWILPAILLSIGLAAGCTSVPADVAVDMDRLNQNNQYLLPKFAAQAAAVVSDATATNAQRALAKHDFVLATQTAVLSEAMNRYMIAHSDSKEVAAIKAKRAGMATPRGGN